MSDKAEVYLDYDFVADPENIFARTNKVMELRLFIDGAGANAADFIEAYRVAIAKHNTGIFFNSFYDAGFDLLCPEDICASIASPNKINFKVKCCAKIIYESRNRCHNTGFYMYSRSSLSKTPLRLANSVGIIDSGYRGNLIGVFDNISGNSSDYFVNKFDKLVQICAPSLVPIYVRLVENIEDLGETTLRGCGGFGSTGK
jgi:dUTP pyrophosphatase